MDITILPYLEIDFKFELSGYTLAPLASLEEELGNTVFAELWELQERNHAFINELYKVNKENLVVLISKDGGSKIFIDSLFFHMHKGGHEKLLCSPNRFSIEDFKSITYGIPEYNPGTLIERQKFKFNIHNKISDKVFLPTGYENITLDMVNNGYVFQLTRDNFVGFDSFFNACRNDVKLQRSVHFYNKSIDNSLNDDERILFSCCAIEVILDVGEESRKRDTIKNRLDELINEISFKFIEQGEVSKRLKNVIDVLYDFRSGYVHSGNAITRKAASEWDFIEESQLAMFSLSLTSFLISRDFIRKEKFEGLLCSYFFSQDILIETIDYFRVSVDDIAQKVARNAYDCNIFEQNLRFAHLCDLQTLLWDESLKSKWLRAMDYLIGWMYPHIECFIKNVDKKSAIRHELISESHDDINNLISNDLTSDLSLIYSIYRNLYLYNQRKWALY
ncbi:HEPN domain-containing protein [Photobacterium leiognathi]|uniref:HEPN domain-containing protein n=1 Tax=Photobacterium leiognathi TaxID=553611 RepID=UPI00076AC79B|nr:HEPN domain-containing protein [Photobacterium leiognathi]